METVELVIKNANELVTLQGPNTPRTKADMQNLGIISHGTIAVDNGTIVAVGQDIKYKGDTMIDATGKIVVPGFIDPHTHVVFAGSREFELNMKLQGASYMEIMQKGGGIYYTVRKTREASLEDLVLQGTKRLDTMLRYGTTTCEGKTGYGLNVESELKLLYALEELNKKHKVDVIPTFLGAHAIPQDQNAEEYIALIFDEMLPQVQGHARFCDVFCEKGVFTPEQSRQILEEGKKMGLLPKLHADEIVDTGGAALAAEVGAISADHLLMSSQQGLQQMAAAQVVGVLLPGTPFSLMIERYADARSMIDMGVPIALATDLNPNCWTESMQFMMQLGCLKMKMTPAEALTAATFNAACAIGMQSQIGSLEVDKQADIVVLDCPNHQYIPYHFGVNLVDTVIKKGMVVDNNEKIISIEEQQNKHKN
jgi:imidazolonepropionase